MDRVAKVEMEVGMGATEVAVGMEAGAMEADVVGIQLETVATVETVHDVKACTLPLQEIWLHCFPQ